MYKQEPFECQLEWLFVLGKVYFLNQNKLRIQEGFVNFYPKHLQPSDLKYNLVI